MLPAEKIGILTFHRCINYGSYWQARCLAEGLRARGCNAVLLDHDSRRVNRAEWRCALEPLLPRRTSSEDLPLYAEKVRRFFAAFEQLPLSRRFALDNPGEMESCDTVIVGSDEVWNLRHPWYGGYPAFYGEGLRAKNIVSYAASFGNQAADEGLDGQWAGRLRNFSQISIRDQNSKRIIEDALDAEPALVLDPCLQFPEAIERRETPERRPYLALYGHNFPRWFAQNTRAWADERSLDIVSIGYRSDWANEHWIEAGPEDFPGFIAGADAVATNFFHGCVFSLLFGRPFAAALSDYRANKVRDLAAAVGAERHLVSEATPASHYAGILGEAPDPAIAGRIGALRRQSDAYLDAVLN
jgi:hypothetical protein